MRFRLTASLASGLTVSLAALALAACSEAKDTDQATPAAELTSEAPMADETAAVTPETVATQSATPEPTPTPAPSAAPTPKATPTKEAAPAPEPVAAAAPPAAFARCAVCHNSEKGAGDKLGPNLYGVYGHKMGQGSFAFSDAVKNSGLTMDADTLDKWLENPRTLVPGNRMSFPGLKDAAKRQEIIDYLKQLK